MRRRFAYGRQFFLLFMHKIQNVRRPTTRLGKKQIRYAEGKRRAAQLRLARSERSILRWSRILADLRYERSCAIQPLLWPEEETSAKN
jgi:hypothetical protein